MPPLDVSVFESEERAPLFVDGADVCVAAELVPDVAAVELSLADVPVDCEVVTFVVEGLPVEEPELWSGRGVDVDPSLVVLGLDVEVEAPVGFEVSLVVPDVDGTGSEPDDCPHANAALDAARVIHSELVLARRALVEILLRCNNDA